MPAFKIIRLKIVKTVRRIKLKFSLNKNLNLYVFLR